MESDQMNPSPTIGDGQNAFAIQRRLRIRRALVENLLFVLTIGGIVVGFAVGFGVRELKPSKEAITWIGKQFNLWETFCIIYYYYIAFGKLLYLWYFNVKIWRWKMNKMEHHVSNS